MADRDITGEVAQRTSKVIGRLRERLQASVPLGPLREQMSSKEARLRLQRLDPAMKISMIQEMGEDEWNALVEKITNAT